MQQPSNCNSSGSNNSSISNTATNISNNSYHYSTTLNTNHDSSFSSLVRKYKSRSSLTTNSIASNCNIPLTLQSLPGVNSNPHHPSPLNSNSTFTPTTLPPPSLTTDTSLFLSHGIHGGALGHQSELSTPPGISGGLSSLAHHPLNNPLAASAAPVDILAPASSLVTASPLVSASAFGGPNGGLGSGVTGGCDSPTSGGAASVAAAAAYAYRNTPYYYFYPGATDFSSAFDTGGLAATGGVLPGVTGAHHTPAVGEPEQCKVCGDYASGVHFGVLTCEGCKGFFKRNHRDGVTSNSDSKSTPLTCNRDQKCEINVASRNSCRSCRYRKCLAAGMSRDSIKLGRRSKNEKVILSKDCEKSTARGGNSLMTFISPRSLTNPITPFSPYPDLKSPLKSFGTSPSYNVSTDGYLSTHRPSNYGLSFDYSSYRPDAHNFYVPTQPNTGGIYSGINPMEPMNSFDLYASSATNHSAVPPTSVPQLAALGSTNSASSLLPNISMPKLEPMTGNDLQLTTSQRETTLSHVSTAQNPISSPNYTIATGSDISGSASANFNSHFLTHPSSANGHHGFFSTNHSDSLTNFANHNSVHSTGHGTNSWSIIDHIVTY
ncbi:uncharacterized protein LOC142337470 [Convolutriloba macropyga]|uniref:uncharacterized protein LOC142337470 n=1 Tax=Convolutriloba macropyga TaxID=536237 RepID=UPI003F52470D